MKKWLALLTTVTCMSALTGCDGSMMKTAGLNTLLGMGMVFVVLVLIIFIISLFEFIPKIQKKQAEKKAAKEAAKNVSSQAVENTIAQIIEKEENELCDDLELVAVISAAIAAYEGTGADGFVVRSIKKKSSKWQRA